MAIQPVEQGSAFAFRNVINNNFYELKVLSGASKPTQSTAAVVGQMYLDTSEGKMYFCSKVSGSVYTWKPFSEFSGSYNDLEDKPSLFSGNYNDLTNKPDSSKISYNNNLSSLEADNVQKAIDEIISLKAVKNGFATLDSSGKVPSVQLPSMNYIPNSQKGVANGVATLDNNLKLPTSQLTTSVESLSSSSPSARAFLQNIDVFDYEVKSYIKYGPFLLISINAYAQESGEIPTYFPILISNLGHTIVRDSSLISAKYLVFTSAPSLTDTGGIKGDAAEVYVENSASSITCTFRYDHSSSAGYDYNYCAVGFTVLALIDN